MQLPTYEESRKAPDSAILGDKLFKEGVQRAFLSRKKNYEVRVLPAFDLGLLNSPEFATSWVPYRRQGTASKENPHDLYSNWLYAIKFYTSLGPKRLDFVSPASGYAGRWTCEKGIDPFEDMRELARSSDRPEWVRLTKRETRMDSQPLEGFRYGWAMNILYREFTPQKPQPWRLGIYLMSNGAYMDVDRKLSMKRGADDLILGSEDWKRYMLGDITDPEHGLKAAAYNTKIVGDTGASFETITFHFTNVDDMLEGVEVMSLKDLTVRRDDKDLPVLQARYHIPDSVAEHTYEEMLEWAVQIPEIPYELIQSACGPFVGFNNIPKRPGTTTTSSPEPAKKAAASAPPAQPASTQSAAVPKPPAPEKAPAPKLVLKTPDVSKTFHVSVNGGSARVMSVSDICELVDAHDIKDAKGLNMLVIQLYDADKPEAGWQSLGASGFEYEAAIPPPPPTPPQDAPAPPPPPPAVPPPPPPSKPDTSAAAGKTANGLTEAEAKQLAEIERRFEEDPDSLSSDELEIWNDLKSKVEQ